MAVSQTSLVFDRSSPSWVLARSSEDYYSLWVCLILSSWLDSGNGVWGKTVTETNCRRHHLPRVPAIRRTYPWWHSVGSSGWSNGTRSGVLTVNLLTFPPFPHTTLRKAVTMYSPCLRHGGQWSTSLREKYLRKLFGILLYHLFLLL